MVVSQIHESCLTISYIYYSRIPRTSKVLALERYTTSYVSYAIKIIYIKSLQICVPRNGVSLQLNLHFEIVGSMTVMNIREVGKCCQDCKVVVSYVATG